MSAQVQAEDAVRELLVESARWRLVGLLFRRPQTGWTTELATVAREVTDPDLSRAAELAAEATEGAYLAILGPGSPVSPREAGHRPHEDPGKILAHLTAFYDAFVYRSEREDPLDHVAVEADFAGYLALKEAYARASGSEENARLTREARARFLETHLRSIAAGLADRLEGAEGHLALAASALMRLSGATAADAAGPPPMPSMDCGFECGGAGSGLVSSASTVTRVLISGR